MSYTGMIAVTIPENQEAADIPTMKEMPTDAYMQYVDQTLFFFDHHENLRSSFGDYPIATTPDQIDALIRYLEHIKERMRDA